MGVLDFKRSTTTPTTIAKGTLQFVKVGTRFKMLVGDNANSPTEANYLPFEGGTLTGGLTLNTSIASPLILTRTGDVGINMNGSYLGVSGGVLRFGTSTTHGNNATVWHSGNSRSNTENDDRYPLKTLSITAGTGLTGGGNLSANRTLSVDFGTAANTVAMGNDSRINNGQTAYGWGNHKSAGYWDITTNTGYLSPSNDVDLNTLGNGVRGLAASMAPNHPTGSGFADIMTKSQHGSADQLQLSFPFRGNDHFAFRTKSSSGFSDWRSIWHSGNSRSNAENDDRFLKLSGGTLTGGLVAPTLEATAALTIPKIAPVSPDPNKVYLYLT